MESTAEENGPDDSLRFLCFLLLKPIHQYRRSRWLPLTQRRPSVDGETCGLNRSVDPGADFMHSIPLAAPLGNRSEIPAPLLVRRT